MSAKRPIGAGVEKMVPSLAVRGLALVLGTEGSGLRASTLTSTDVRVRIPMSADVDSLNVAAAVAVACYATRGQR